MRMCWSWGARLWRALRTCCAPTPRCAMLILVASSRKRLTQGEFGGLSREGQNDSRAARRRNTMRLGFLALLAATTLTAITGGAAQAQEILLGNLFAGAGPFATLARTNEIAAQMAAEEINAGGGVNGKKIRIISFDTAGKPEQAVVGVRKLAED